MKEEKNEAKFDGVTDGGYEYIETSDGRKLRNSMQRRRLDEDGETYDEYKLRQRSILYVEKNKRKGTAFWSSKQWGTYVKPKTKTNE